MLFAQLQTAAAHGDMAQVNNTSRALTEILRELGKLTGEILNAAPVTNNITNNYATFIASPAFAELQAMLVQQLAPFPDALNAVLAGLDSLDRKASDAPALIDLKPIQRLDADHG
jgi:hypothetical protein